MRICNPHNRQFWSSKRFNVSGLHLYLPLMLRFRKAALTEGYQMGKVKVPAASAVVFRVTRVNRREIPRRCQRVDESPLQYCICSAVGAPGRIAACKFQDVLFRLSQGICQTPIRGPRPIPDRKVPLLSGKLGPQETLMVYSQDKHTSICPQCRHRKILNHCTITCSVLAVRDYRACKGLRIELRRSRMKQE